VTPELKARRAADAEAAWQLKLAVMNDEVRDKSGEHIPTPTALRLMAATSVFEDVEGKPLQRTADETPPLSPEQQAERQRVQAEMLRLLQAAAKPEPLTIEGQATEEQAVRVPRKR
jgi:hypothetical protein